MFNNLSDRLNKVIKNLTGQGRLTESNIKDTLRDIRIALLFSVILGPVGLLYASFWGGVAMIVVGIVVVSSKLLFPIILLWIICCIWSVRAVELSCKKE